MRSPPRLPLLGLAAASLALSSLGRAQETTDEPLECAIVGSVSGIVVRTRAPRRRVALDGVVARLVPRRRGLVAVSATLEDGTTIDGTTRTDISFEIGTAGSLVGGALVVRAGARIADLDPIAGTASATVDVVLDEGVVARGVACPCSALRPATGEALDPRAETREPAVPRWRPRVHDLHLRSGDAPDRGEDLHLDVTDATLELVERERHRDWARVTASLPGGDVGGWTRDTDLAPAPRR